MKARTIWLVAMAGLIGCADDRTDDHVADGGGFETGNIQARVTTPSGHPAARAMVWLVSSQGDTAPARVLDSAWTNSVGIADLRFPRKTERFKLGLDAKLGDSLGIVHGSLSHSDSANVALAASGSVEAWVDSTRQIPTLFVPGSHFLSERADGAPKSVLRLPQGTWDIALKTLTKTQVLRQIETDATTRQLGEPAWSTKNLDWSDSLRLPKPIVLDSMLYRDPSLEPLDKWQPLQGTIDGIDFSGTPTFAGSDSSILQVGYGPTGSGLQISSLPLVGALSSNFGFDPSSPIDSNLVRTITIRNADSSGGLRIVLDPRAKDQATVEYLGTSHESTFAIEPTSQDPILDRNWIIAWDSKYFYVASNGALIACAYQGSTNASAPFVQYQAYSAFKGVRLGLIQLSQTRLYQPK